MKKGRKNFLVGVLQVFYNLNVLKIFKSKTLVLAAAPGPTI